MPTSNSVYEDFIYLRTYSRWIESLGRRETWEESVGRFAEYFERNVPSALSSEYLAAVELFMRKQTMPSMRAFWTAGPALDVDNIAAYNCSALAITHPRHFSEILYVLMNGVGCGFSVERQFISQMPSVPEKYTNSGIIKVGDSKRGWAEALLSLIKSLYRGERPKWDMSAVRPTGARLRTFGGRASGPEPLNNLFEFVVRTFEQARGRKLNSIECHDIACKIAEIVVVGGVRRSACISLSNRSDDRMAHAKDGFFWDNHPHRMMANNSIAYTEKPAPTEFMQDWLDLMRSEAGERGIFNRESAQFVSRVHGRRDWRQDFLTNP